MVQREIAESVAREWCTLHGRPDQQQAVADVIEHEKTRIAFNTLLREIENKARFLPLERKTQLQRLIERILLETALKAVKTAENETNHH